MITAMYEITYIKKIKTKRTLKRKKFKDVVASSSIFAFFGIRTAKRLEKFTREVLHGTMLEYEQLIPWYNIIPINIAIFKHNRKLAKKGK